MSEIKSITEGIKNLRKVITFPQFQSITAYSDDGEDEEDAFIGDIAEQYLRKFASVSGADKNGKFYIGKKETEIKENNIIVCGKKYIGTPGLWHLIVATTPDDKLFTNRD